MNYRILFLLILLFVFFLTDFYTLKAFETVFPNWINRITRYKFWYWGLKILLIGATVALIFIRSPSGLKRGFIIGFFSMYISQFILLLFSLVDEIRRIVIYGMNFYSAKNSTNLVSPEALSSIPRSEFLAKSGLILGGMAYLGLVSGRGHSVYDYRVRQVKLYLPGLPSSFEGIRITQISDIHSGSFFDFKEVKKGVELVLAQKTDIIFFTGDLINNRSEEMKDYYGLFSKLKAPLGVFSVLGNHDYGDYGSWNSEAEKKKDHEVLIQIHKEMGYDLLQNTHRKIRIGQDEVSIIGVENWSALSHFPKHGRLQEAVIGTETSAIRLLLSHDPSHWRAEVLPHFPQIEATFSGHTHGMQMGIRLPNFQWSPIQYMYPEWAGLYTSAHQHIYVNVGFGFIGYPGRLGILPEITVFTLSSKHA